MNIKESVTKVISDHLGQDPKEIDRKLKLEEDLGADSLDVMEIVMSLEEEFGIVIDDADIEKCVTVQDVIDLVAKAMITGKQ